VSIAPRENVPRRCTAGPRAGTPSPTPSPDRGDLPLRPRTGLAKAERHGSSAPGRHTLNDTDYWWAILTYDPNTVAAPLYIGDGGIAPPPRRRERPQGALEARKAPTAHREPSTSTGGSQRPVGARRRNGSRLDPRLRVHGA